MGRLHDRDPRVNSPKDVREPSGRQLARNIRVVATSLGGFIQLFLAEEDFMVQARQVRLCTGGQENASSFVSSDTSIRANILACGVCAIFADLGTLAPGPLLLEKFLAGEEPVDPEMQRNVELAHQITPYLAVMPVILHELADD